MSYVTIKKRGYAGIIDLDRPKVLNAFKLHTIDDISTALDKFETDPGIDCVVLRSNHDQAFCAGRDLHCI